MLIAVSAMFFLCGWAKAGNFDNWKSYTSTSQVRYMDYFDDSLQVVTSGGWLKIDPLTEGMRKITNIDGLGTNNLYYVLKDGNGAAWVAGYGRLIKESEGTLTPYLFFDNDNNLRTLHAIADDGDQLWIGTSGGLALFSKIVDGGQIEDFYFRFGNFSAALAVFDLLLQEDTILIATSEGLAVANKTDPNFLKSFSNWKTLKPSRFVPTLRDTVTALTFYHDKLFLGTTQGVFRMDIAASDTSLTEIAIRAGSNIKHMITTGDSLVIYSDKGFFIYTDASIYWSITPAIKNRAFSCGRFVGLVHWLGDYISGVYHGTDTTYYEFDDGGLPGNQVTALSSDAEGNIAGGFSRDGVAAFDGNLWNNLQAGGIVDGATSVLHDNMGNTWYGSWGGGLTCVSNDTIINFKEENSSLHGVFDRYSYVVVNGLAKTSNYLFVVNYAARDQNAISVVDQNDLTRWISFGAGDGISDNLLNAIDCYEGVFVAGTADNGVYYYYYGPDPFDKSDDSAVILRENNRHLSSDNVRTINFDNRGDLWVGTMFGLSLYDRGIDQFVTTPLPIGYGPDINRLTFDRRGNIWMGSHSGLARCDAGTGDIQIFTTLNSGLSDDNITALMVNPKTNDLWAGTREGISRLASLIGPPTKEISRVIAFPNPFVIGSSDDVLSFNYDGSAMVRIYTVNGELVKEFDINIPWNGKNQQNENVAPGVYLYLLTGEDGSVGKGKILLIRQ